MMNANPVPEALCNYMIKNYFIIKWGLEKNTSSGYVTEEPIHTFYIYTNNHIIRPLQ